ncbi:DUF7064 domain-containing protein [Cupriavidus metallidurans]|uniref:DUF7064 domain-containing protein n=1 Tax=Cupriavidus metallidurans (strain ATCC 43123 / DSM 2839 / NBRC 102507 / CH34) TaxID=266264 RepID=Q1LBU5_CUPMC|nr:hypothetical protein [Cupriavidus metallidurans]ABF12381.1 conserved hypothetical protein [Cupriavidus metallidurans CH34]QGS32389.1 hypothetical protein FOB83_26505 [Cupriavidus metallidurans]
MYKPPNTKLRLSPQDEYTHAPEAARNYNESMYFNAFDTAKGVGLWLRIGNRVNEGYAEMSCCVYLPGGKVGFMFARPMITHNDAMDAGGMRFEVMEPFKRLRVKYEGELLIMDEPAAMADPSAAFKRYQKRPSTIYLEFEGVSPMHGGEIVNLDDTPIDLDPENSVYRGHTEQHMAVSGTVTVDGTKFKFENGTGYRDKSWGPRHWHNFSWYKWLPVAFDRDFGMLFSVKDPTAAALPISGNVLSNGEYEPVIDGRIWTEYDDDYHPKLLTAWITTTKKTYIVEGKVLSTVPLRHRKAGGDASSYTRITESMTEYTCEGRTVLGMTEYCDIIQDGVPLSVRQGRA